MNMNMHPAPILYLVLMLGLLVRSAVGASMITNIAVPKFKYNSSITYFE